MQLADRVEKVPPYLFVEISRKIAAKKSQVLKYQMKASLKPRGDQS